MRTITSLSRWVCAALCMLALNAPAFAQPRPIRTVLVIHWSAESFPSTPVVDGALRNTLLSWPAQPVEYFTEYLESDLFSVDHASLTLRDYIRRKYAGRSIDAVVTVSNPALDFALKYRSTLFPDAPIVASVTASPDPRLRVEGAGLTGLVTGTSYDETLDLALTLHPGTRRVFVIAYAPTFGMPELVRRELTVLSPQVPLVFIEEQSVDRLLEVVRAVPPDSLILFLRHSSEEPGDVLYPSDVARLVSEASPVPVYGANETYVGTGVVGGIVTSREGIGNRLGQQVRLVLSGRRARDIPMEPVAAAPVFDWRALQRWDIDSSRLPAGSVVRFRSFTPWELYRWHVFGAGILLIVESALLAALLAQRRKRRRVEAALREREEHFRVMADTAPVLIWRAGADKKCDFLNSPWREFVGRSVGQDLGGRWVACIHPVDRDRVAGVYRSAFESRESFGIEYRLQRFDGEYRWLLDTGVPRWEVNGSFAGYIGSCLDITDRKRAESAVREIHAELARVSRLAALGEFAASIAHEVRQPLTAIMMNARSCLRGIGQPRPDLQEVRAGLLDVVEASQRADEVIKRNRDLFRDHAIKTTKLDINAVVRQTVVLANTRLSDSQVTLIPSLANDLPSIEGDSIELEQVLLNLLSNAIDAMDGMETGARRIEVSSSWQVAGGVTVSVRDSGVGLKHVDADRMFDLSYTTKATGTGVGLSVSRSIIEAHGGRIWAEENPEGGAVFSFTLPTSHGESAIESQTPSEPPATARAFRRSRRLARRSGRLA